MFYVLDTFVALIEKNIDDHGDSYTRDSNLDELQKVNTEKVVETTNAYR